MIAVTRIGPGIHCRFPHHSLFAGPNDAAVTLTREEADALFDALGAVLGRDAGLPKDRRMPAPPADPSGSVGQR